MRRSKRLQKKREGQKSVEGERTSQKPRVVRSSWTTTLPIRDPPENFSFVGLGEEGEQEHDPWNGEVAGSGLPGSEAEMETLYHDLGVTLIVSLTEEHRLPLPVRTAPSERRFRVLSLPYPDGGLPTDEMALRALHELGSEVAAGGRALVHCFAGVGRTGTILALWVAWRLQKSAQDAIALLRKYRPSSMCWAGQVPRRFHHQEQFVEEFLKRHPRPKGFPRAFLPDDVICKHVAIDAFSVVPHDPRSSDIEPAKVNLFRKAPFGPELAVDSAVLAEWGGSVPRIDVSSRARALLRGNEEWVHLQRPGGWGKTTLLRAIADEFQKPDSEKRQTAWCDLKRAPLSSPQAFQAWLRDWTVETTNLLGIESVSQKSLRCYNLFWDNLNRHVTDRGFDVLLVFDHFDWPYFCDAVLKAPTGTQDERDVDTAYLRKLARALHRSLQEFIAPLRYVVRREGSRINERKPDSATGAPSVRVFSAARFPIHWFGQEWSEPFPFHAYNPDLPVGLTPSEIRPLLQRLLLKPEDVEKTLARMDQLYGRGAIDVARDPDGLCESAKRFRSAVLDGVTCPTRMKCVELTDSDETEEILDQGRKLLSIDTWQIAPKHLFEFLSVVVPGFGALRSGPFREKDPLDKSVESLMSAIGCEIGWLSPKEQGRSKLLFQSIGVDSGLEPPGACIPAYCDGTVPLHPLSRWVGMAFHRGLGNVDFEGSFRALDWSSPSGKDPALDAFLDGMTSGGTKDVRNSRVVVERCFRQVSVSRNNLWALRRLGKHWFPKKSETLGNTQLPACKECLKKESPNATIRQLPLPISNVTKLACALTWAYFTRDRPRFAVLMSRTIAALEDPLLFVYWFEVAWLRPTLDKFDRRNTKWLDLGARWEKKSPDVLVLRGFEVDTHWIGLRLAGLDNALRDHKCALPEASLDGDLPVFEATTCQKYVHFETMKK